MCRAIYSSCWSLDTGVFLKPCNVVDERRGNMSYGICIAMHRIPLKVKAWPATHKHALSDMGTR